MKVTLKNGAVIELSSSEELATVLLTMQQVEQPEPKQESVGAELADFILKPEPKPKPKKPQKARTDWEKYKDRPPKDPELVAKIWVRHNEGMSNKQIAKVLGTSKTTVQRALKYGKGPADATTKSEDKGGNGATTHLQGAANSYGGRKHDVGTSLPQEIAAAVIKSPKQPLHVRQIRRLPGVARGSKEAIGSRLAKAVEMGLIQRVREGYYASPSYKAKDWEFTSYSKDQAVKEALPVVKFMTEHPEIQDRSGLIDAAVKAGLGPKTSVGVRLWAAKATKMVTGSGYPHRGGTGLQVTDFGLEEASKQDQ